MAAEGRVPLRALRPRQHRGRAPGQRVRPGGRPHTGRRGTGAADRAAVPGGMNEEVIEADLTWLDSGFRAGVRVRVDASGRIASAGEGGPPATRRIRNAALLPGFVNTHSHAFQRALRGSGELFPAGSGSFWTWREAMYGLVERLDRDSLARICRQAFAEMRDAGTTAVGEFTISTTIGRATSRSTRWSSRRRPTWGSASSCCRRITPPAASGAR